MNKLLRLIASLATGSSFYLYYSNLPESFQYFFGSGLDPVVFAVVVAGYTWFILGEFQGDGNND